MAAIIKNFLNKKTFLEKVTSNKISLLIGFVVFLFTIARVIYFGFGSIDNLIAVVPDDAFYYIQVSRNHSISGHWTFDGVVLSSGFHFFYGYLLSFIYTIFPKLGFHGLFLIIGFISSISIAIACYFISKLISDFFCIGAFLLAVSTFLLSPVTLQSSIMMESWLAILFSSLTIFLIFSKVKTQFKLIITCILLGILGSLARTDYGMLPAILFFSILFVHHNNMKNDALKKSFFIFLGSILGILFLMMHTYFAFGHYFQASAEIKYYWSALSGHPLISTIELLFLLAFPFLGSLSKAIGLVLCGILLISIFIIFLSVYKNYKKAIPLHISCFFGCAITILGYIFFYRFNSQALQVWYFANFIAPVSICVASISHFMFNYKNKLLYLGLLIFFFSFYISHKTLFYAPYPHQVSMMKAAVKIKNNYLDGNFGAWNAGIFSFFSERAIVNIDGLINDEVLGRIKSNTLLDYFKERRITYLIDYQAMIETKAFRIKGGYNDTRLDQCISNLIKVDDKPSGWGAVTIYKVNLDCL